MIVLTPKGKRALETATLEDNQDSEVLERFSAYEGMEPEHVRLEFDIDPNEFKSILRRLQAAGLIEIKPYRREEGNILGDYSVKQENFPLKQPGFYFRGPLNY